MKAKRSITTSFFGRKYLKGDFKFLRKRSTRLVVKNYLSCLKCCHFSQGISLKISLQHPKPEASSTSGTGGHSGKDGAGALVKRVRPASSKPHTSFHKPWLKLVPHEGHGTNWAQKKATTLVFLAGCIIFQIIGLEGKTYRKPNVLWEIS